MDLSVDEFVIADEPDAWSRAGFSIDEDGVCRAGSVRLQLGGAGSGVIGWSLRGLSEPVVLDGVPTGTSKPMSVRPPAEPSVHPNGVVMLDHAVLMSPDLERTARALATIGLHERRRREGELNGSPISQVFYRLGEVVLELVGSPGHQGDGPAHFWGLTFTVGDIDKSADLLGENAGRIKDAVQPGRRIVTLRHRALGMSVATAFITPDPRRPGS